MSWDQQYNENFQYDQGGGQYGGYTDKKNDEGNGYYNPSQYPEHGQQQYYANVPNSYSSYGDGGSEYSQSVAPPTPAYAGVSPGPAGYPGPPGHNGGQPQMNTQFMVPGSQMLQDPMVTNLAMSYGRDFVGKGQEEIKKNLDKYVSIGQLKYYFAVDNSYVSKKLGLLLFPFAHKDWSIRYNHDEPVQPRFELNAADLYIPSMAFVTYILVVGYMLGVQDRFSPEILATTASGALTALVLEIVAVYLIISIMSISSTLAKWDFLAFSMYKYVGMIVCLVCGLLLSRTGYYVSLLYSTMALALFLFRTLHLRVEPEVHGVENHGKRKLWLILVMVVWQPLMMWWLTYSLIPTPVAIIEPPL